MSHTQMIEGLFLDRGHEGLPLDVEGHHSLLGRIRGISPSVSISVIYPIISINYIHCLVSFKIILNIFVTYFIFEAKQHLISSLNITIVVTNSNNITTSKLTLPYRCWDNNYLIYWIYTSSFLLCEIHTLCEEWYIYMIYKILYHIIKRGLTWNIYSFFLYIRI